MAETTTIAEIINRKGSFWRLRKPETQQSFNADLLNIIKSTDFLIISVVIDKLRLKQSYPDPFHPYHIALGFMLQRYCGYLNHINRTGDVLAESRGGREDQLLKNAYNHIYVHGDMHHSASFFKQVLTSSELKLKKKSFNIAGLQLADLLAHPVSREILIENGLINESKDTFGRQITNVIQGKYNRHLYDGRVEGYGKILFPK